MSRIINPENMQHTLYELIEFSEFPEFKQLINDLYSTEKEKRFDFVKNVILNKEEIKKRRICIPNNISIERSYFFDDRPTLFCIVKYLEDNTRKVTITFDDN